MTAASPLPTALVIRSTSVNYPTFWGAVLDDISVTTVDAAPPAVPEPATWATLVLGFGLVGGAVRRRPAAARALFA